MKLHLILSFYLCLGAAFERLEAATNRVPHDHLTKQSECHSLPNAGRSDFFISPMDVSNVAHGMSDDSPITQDVYVSTTGSDNNDGLTPDTPFKTVHHAMSRVLGTSEKPVTVHVAAGEYSPSKTGEQFPVTMANFVRIEGGDPESTRLNAEHTAECLVAVNSDYCSISRVTLLGGTEGIYNHASSVVYQECIITWSEGNGMWIDSGTPTIIDCKINDHDNYGVLINDAEVTIINTEIYDMKMRSGINASNSILKLFGCIISNNITEADGGGISLDTCTMTMTGCTVASNTAWYDGGGICCTESVLNLANCLIIRNLSYVSNGGGLFAGNDSEITLNNCTFASNTSYEYGGATYLTPDSSMTAHNSILWSNIPDEIYPYQSPDIQVTYSNVQGGYEGSGNLDTSPLFVIEPEGKFHLSQTAAGQVEDSLCVDAGDVDASENCYEMGHWVVCMDELTTRTDGVPDEGIVDMGFHNFPQGFVTPTPVPTQVPTSPPTPYVTPTPTAHPDGVDISLNATVFHGGDPFSLRAHCFGPAGRPADLYIILDVAGSYWFYPDWTMTPDHHTITLSDQQANYLFILDFIWPSGDLGHGDGVRFWGAMCDAGTSDLLGEVDFVTFGWESGM